MADYSICYRLTPQVLPNKWVRDYFWQRMDKIHWVRLSYGQSWCTVEKQCAYRVVCVCVRVCVCVCVCGASQNRWLRCRIRHLASAFWMTGGEVTAGHIWRGGWETEILYSVSVSLSLSGLLMYESETQAALIWSQEVLSWFCINLIISISCCNGCGDAPRENMQIAW